MSPTRRRPRRHPVRAALRVLLPLAVLAAAFAAAGPRELGGPASYVVTSGSSMLPGMEPGGVAVVRARDDYRVGDVVAYVQPYLRSVVLHRVVGVDGDRFVVQGDNNPEPDRYRPRADEVLGARVAYWAGGGRWLTTLRSPAFGGLALGLATLVALTPTRRPPRRDEPAPPETSETPETSEPSALPAGPFPAGPVLLRVQVYARVPAPPVVPVTGLCRAGDPARDVRWRVWA